MRPAFIFGFFLLLTSGCEHTSSATPTLLRTEGNLTVDGQNRYYLLNLPPNYDEASDFSLVIALHGGGGKASQMESGYLLTEKANRAKFAIVYPEGDEPSTAIYANDLIWEFFQKYQLP